MESIWGAELGEKLSRFPEAKLEFAACAGRGSESVCMKRCTGTPCCHLLANTGASRVLVSTGVLGPTPRGTMRPPCLIRTPPREKEPGILLLLCLSLLLLVRLLNSFQP